ncbi:MAG: ATP-binding cassette domain-containing protein [Bacteroidetes bacterium]|nr:MAG: ATP-binding cassette domain-containing protein [Bacteroidota bacterium]
MIEVQGLGKSFDGNAVFRDLNFRISPGDRLCVLGGSGAGKSVLLKLLLGLESPDEGDILLDQRSVKTFRPADWRQMMDRFGVVFQGAALFDSLTVYENVGIRFIEARRLPPAEIKAAVVAALERVNLSEEILDKYPGQLSGGMRKRVGIARAILHRPAYLMLDEPVTGLDPVNAEAIDELVLELASEPGRTTCMVTHDMQSVRKVATLVMMLAEGSVHFWGSPDAFFASDDPVIRAFLRRLN